MRRIAALVAMVVGLGALVGCSAAGGSSDASAGGSKTSTTRATTSTTTAKPGKVDASRAAYSVAFSDAYEGIDGDRCLSGRAVDTVGVDRLNAAGITPEAFASDEIFTALEVDDAERERLTEGIEAAMEACGTATGLATAWLSDDDPAWDLTSFASCVATPLIPPLTEIIIEGWSGERTDIVSDAVSDALEIGDSGCAEVQVEVAVRSAAEEDIQLTEEERACLHTEYQALAAEHRSLSGSDDADVAASCLDG